MRNKTVYVTIDQLNNSGTVVLDATMTIYQNTIGYGTVSQKLHPNGLQSINQTGVDLQEAFDKKLDIKTKRDHDRHQNNEKLK